MTAMNDAQMIAELDTAIKRIESSAIGSAKEVTCNGCGDVVITDIDPKHTLLWEVAQDLRTTRKALAEQNAKLREALAHLVAVKTHKALFGCDADYLREQPIAWENARKALSCQTDAEG